MAEEIVTIYNEVHEKIGTAPRSALYTHALWHETFHLWLVSTQFGGSLICQLRSKHKKHHGNMLGMTAGGHLAADEALADGLREVVEELNLHYRYDDICFTGWNIHIANEDSNQKKLRIFEAIHIAQYEGTVDSIIPPDPKEVEGLIWVPISLIADIKSNSNHSALCAAFLYDDVAEKFLVTETKVSGQSFVPRSDNYFTKLAVVAERFLEGKKPLVF